MAQKSLSENTNSETSGIITRPEEQTAHSGVIAKAKRIFRRALMLSILAHTPVICGSFTEQNNKWAQKGFFDSGLNMWDWQNEVKETIKKELNLDDKEAEEVMSEVDPKTLEGVEKARRAIEIRKSERAKNVDPAKVKKHKEEIRRKLEAGEKILFRDFIFESEEITMGIEPEIVKNAQKIFFEEMSVLEKEKPEVPTREFLRRIVSYGEEKDMEQNGAYETTQTSLSVYLDRKGKGLRGNCEARDKYMAMALEYLYPERWEDVYMQNSADHIRALFTVGDTTYMMEPGVPILTEQEKAGTIIYKPQRIIELYAGLKTDPVKVAGEVDDKDTKSNLPTMSDHNSEAFPTPKADGKLKMTSRDHSNLYDPRLAPPEVRDMELPQTINGKKTEDIKNKDDKREDEKAKNKKTADRKNHSRKTGGPPETTEFMDIAEWEIVTDDKGEMTEILPIKPRDYSDLEISERVQGGRFYGDNMYIDPDLRAIFNPTPATIKKINSLALDTVVYGDVTLFGQEALSEAFKTKAGEMIFNLKHPHMPMSLEHALRHSKCAKTYKGEIQININRDLKGRRAVIGDEQGLSPDQFSLLMNGGGGLMLNYQQRKNYDDAEVKAVASSNRPYVMMTGVICEGNVEALRHMNASKRTVLVLDGNRYVRAAFQNPFILENLNIKPVEEMFYGSGRNVSPDYNALTNAYTLQYRSEITGMSMLGKERLQKYIDLLERIIAESLPEERRENADAMFEDLREKALNRFRIHMVNTEPIGSMGACMIPETVEEAASMGVKTESKTSEQGVTYTQSWSGEVTVKNGVTRITDDPRFNQPFYVVKLINGTVLSMGWINNEDLFVANPHVPEKISANGRGLGLKDGDEQPYIRVNEDGLVKIQYSDNKFIEFKLEGRPAKISESEETGRFKLLVGPDATEIVVSTQNDGIVRLTTEAFGSPSIYLLKPLDTAHIRIPGDMLHLSLSKDSDVIEIRGESTHGRIVISLGKVPEFTGTNIAVSE